jgi:hypothetical protein
MAPLIQKRDRIAEHIRQHRAILSAVRRAPPELVCEIMAFAQSSDDDEDPPNKPPWSLGHICQSWRQSVLAYPALWSSIFIPGTSLSDQREPPHLVPMIETQLSRSANAPLNVWWSPKTYGGTPDLRVLDLVRAQCNRWRTLVLDIPHYRDGSSLDWLRPVDGHLVALETFEVRGRNIDAEIPDIFSTVPSLRKVFLTDWNFNPRLESVPAIPWVQITHYTGAFTADVHLEIANTATNLLSCAIGFPRSVDTFDRGTVAVLPSLRRLYIELPDFLHRMQAPLLEELFCSYSGPEEGQSEILPFIQRSSCSLQRLVLRRCTIDSDLRTILQSLPNLTHLIIEAVSQWIEEEETEDQDDETSEQIALFDALANSLCPNLTSFGFGFGFKFAESQFFAMARSRFRREPPSACLTELSLFRNLSYENRDECPAGTEVAIQAMWDEGFDVDFLESRDAMVDLLGDGRFSFNLPSS